ncbi:unnamed protein product [Nippostrongylus brasiliensis]|uniref:Protein lifeguard 1-like n=1 Tax=Nippostrongylus brasiliensis TaxID=27835 RepID=A0A0N4YWX9_NIPBR|nr:unnamed protein product [Nippostrongylus brasiliensis]
MPYMPRGYVMPYTPPSGYSGYMGPPSGYSGYSGYTGYQVAPPPPPLPPPPPPPQFRKALARSAKTLDTASPTKKNGAEEDDNRCSNKKLKDIMVKMNTITELVDASIRLNA